MAKKAAKPVKKVLTKPEAVLEMVRLARKVLKAEGELKQLLIGLGWTGKNVDERVAHCLKCARQSDAVKAKNKLANQTGKKARKKSVKSVNKTSSRRRA